MKLALTENSRLLASCYRGRRNIMVFSFWVSIILFSWANSLTYFLTVFGACTVDPKSFLKFSCKYEAQQIWENDNPSKEASLATVPINDFFEWESVIWIVFCNFFFGDSNSGLDAFLLVEGFGGDDVIWSLCTRVRSRNLHFPSSPNLSQSYRYDEKVQISTFKTRYIMHFIRIIIH